MPRARSLNLDTEVGGRWGDSEVAIETVFDGYYFLAVTAEGETPRGTTAAAGEWRRTSRTSSRTLNYMADLGGILEGTRGKPESASSARGWTPGVRSVSSAASAEGVAPQPRGSR